MSFKPSGVVTLLTDFGTRDEYVGSMKGVILTIFPEARLVDISHEVEPQDIMGASFILANCYRHFPRGTVHCVVVDPGVGTERKAIAVRAGDSTFVGPDNGIFSRVYSLEKSCEVREISNQEMQREEISDTFHGRDIFSPASAHLAKGVPFEEVGPVVGSFVQIGPSEPVVWERHIKGEVIHIDSYGNIITNIGRELFRRITAGNPFKIEINGRAVERLVRNYQDGEWGSFLALFGSSGMLEVSVRGGSAERRIGAGKGDTVMVGPKEEDLRAEEPLY